ncbi:hypothetical protein GCM10027034_44380 [Ramlibacter solisilvae]|uniref:Uncharacterized protein n=1 Tax=Ramlibacter tataouinensis TaxID=94132 RepID=A0A127JT03_9BURK|nr:hypothetical protein [Ramlibacter tataouinensis]AMO23117.1 hypothetical protein UC35_09695 [Ramlibacter tataouinensis]
MDNIIVYLDDAHWALQQLAPMATGAGAARTHWVLVACPPRMTRRISKWVNHAAREQWREKWSAKLFEQVEAPLRQRGHEISKVIAKGPLPALTQQLTRMHQATHVLDARRPKFGYDMPPVVADQPASQEGRWQVPGAIIGMGAMLVLAD